MKTHWKILVACLQFLLILVLLLGTQATVKADQLDEGTAAYKAGNYQKAFKLLKPLAEQGNAFAQTRIGNMYNNGHGVSEDNKEAEKWYRKAAEQGDVGAQTNLGSHVSPRSWSASGFHGGD